MKSCYEIFFFLK